MEVLNRETALRNANGDEELFKRRCQSYSATSEAAVRSVEKALENRDAPALGRIASELRRSSIEIGAEGMEALTSQLLAAAAAEDWSEVASLVTKFGMELGWFQRVIDEDVCSGNL